MISRLRRWMASWRWRVIVVIGCLAFIALMIWLGPFIRASPWSVRVVVFVLGSIAVLVGGLIITHALALFLMSTLWGTELSRRTPKAKEKLADSLMSVGTATLSATLIGLFVFPLTAFIQALANKIDPLAALVAWWPPNWWSDWHTFGLIGLSFMPVSMGLLLQRRALDLYDELSTPPSLPSVPAVDPATYGP